MLTQIVGYGELKLFQRSETDVQFLGAFALKEDRDIVTVNLHDSALPEYLVAHSIAFIQFRHVTWLINL
jgi:hypothetical protein